MAKKRRGRGEGAIFWSEAKRLWVGKAPGSRRQFTARTKPLLMAKMARAGLSSDRPLTLSAYLDDWLALCKNRIEPATYADYEVTVRVHLKPGLGHLKLGQITADCVERWLAGVQANGTSGATAGKWRRHLHTALRAAARKGLVSTAATAEAQTPRQEWKEIRPFTPDEVKAILKAARGRKHSALFYLMIATGARVGELAALGWEHVQQDCSSVRFERSLQAGGGFKATKTRRGRRTVSLPRFAQEELARHRGKAGRSTGLAFLNAKGEALHRTPIRVKWKALLKRAGVEYRVPHNCRHTHASQLLAAGVSVVEVARRLGDRPETILRVYAHHIPGSENAPTILDSLYG